MGVMADRREGSGRGEEFTGLEKTHIKEKILDLNQILNLKETGTHCTFLFIFFFLIIVIF